MAINKSFVIKNGLEVSTDLILADANTRRVGVGTTAPQYLLHVNGGIGVTNAYVSGIGTFANELNVGLGGTVLTVLGLGNSIGIGTAFPAFLLDIRSPVSTGQTALFVQGDVKVTGDLNIDDISITNLNVSGVSTFVGFATFNSNILVAGISTFVGFATFRNNILVAGISTFVGFATFNDYVFIQDGLNVTGTGATLASLNVSGVSTFVGFATFNNNIFVAGIGTITTLNSTDGTITNITGTSGTITNLVSTSGTITNLVSTSGTITTLGSTNGNITNLVSTSGTITNLTGTSGTITNLVSISGTITNLVSTSGTITTLGSTNGNITNLVSTSGTITNLVSTSGTITNLVGTSGTITTLNSTSGTITNLVGTSGTITTLNSTDGTITNITGTSGTITTLNSTSGTITNLVSTSGTITNLTGTNISYSGISTLGTVRISSGIITATSGVVTYFGDGSNLTGLAGNPTLQTVLNTGNTSTIGMSISGVITATSFFGNGSGLTGVGLGTTGSINTSGIITATSFFGNGSGLTGAGSTVFIDTTTNQEFFPLFTATTSGTITASGISTSKLTYNPSTGAMTAVDFNSTSDINLKENIHTVGNALDITEQLRGVSFDWKETGKGSYGVIAQELQEILPELVTQGDIKSVNYNGLIGVLIEAVKELKKEVEDLKSYK